MPHGATIWSRVSSWPYLFSRIFSVRVIPPQSGYALVHSLLKSDVALENAPLALRRILFLSTLEHASRLCPTQRPYFYPTLPKRRVDSPPWLALYQQMHFKRPPPNVRAALPVFAIGATRNPGAETRSRVVQLLAAEGGVF